MRLILLSLGFTLLLVASLGAKINSKMGGGLAATDPDDADILALFKRHGFAVTRAEANTDPVWITGTLAQCRVDIASISPRGWHRTVVKWHASGKTLHYTFDGGLFAEQPVLKPTAIHYLNRLKRYAGLNAPAVKVRAVVIARECPADILPTAELVALSQ